MPLSLRPRIAVIGAGNCSKSVAAIAYNTGNILGKNGYDIVCGGLGGVMEAASKGCFEAGGTSIGILPTNDVATANPYISVPVVTGLGNMRNVLVVNNAAAVIALDGEYGTLSEIALALKAGKKVISIGDWSKIKGVIIATDATEATDIVRKLIPTSDQH